MPTRLTLFVSVTTDPGDRSAAAPHSGGWTESWYCQKDGFQDVSFFQSWGNSRASILAGEATVTGYRQQAFTISGNRLLPGGAASGPLNVPGSYPKDLDVPQAALMVNFSLAGQPQQIRHRLAAIPDSQVTMGEYQPDQVFKGMMTKYINAALQGFGLGAVLGAVVHDLNQQDVRVVSIIPVAGTPTATLVTSAATGTQPGGWIRLHRVRDDNGNPISGAFVVQATQPTQGGMQSYTLGGYTTSQSVTTANGLARNDLLITSPIVAGTVNRIVVRRIGRPFVQYRGRRSARPRV